MNPNEMMKRLEDFIKKMNPPKTTPNLLEEDQEFIKTALGYPGTMISHNKTAQKMKGRDTLCVFNANLIVEGYRGKVWFGDINVTKSEGVLKLIAEGLGSKVYVLREHDGRFQNEAKPLIENAVYTTDGVTCTLSKEVEQYYERTEKGKILAKEDK